MKRLVGGDYLLDLSSIEIEESEDGSTKTNITDSDVLEQLTNLKKYISNPEMAKPVWVKLKNGENDELVIARGTFAVVDTGEFEICVQLDGYKLVIFIEFTQVLNSDDEPLDDWYIDTNDAKYLFTSDAQNINALVNTGKIDNAKPIYYHGIHLESNDIQMQFVILNNSPTPFTKDTCRTFLYTLLSDYNIINCNGCIKVESVVYPVYIIVNIGTSEEINAKILYHTATSVQNATSLDDYWDNITYFRDGVNKIN